jgi:inner membrane protein involved in colicin E2 resistance
MRIVICITNIYTVLTGTASITSNAKNLHYILPRPLSVQQKKKIENRMIWTGFTPRYVNESKMHFHVI